MKRCRCGHDSSRHRTVWQGRSLSVLASCAVRLPPLEEEELPAWSCPCTRYLEGRLVPLAVLEAEAS